MSQRSPLDRPHLSADRALPACLRRWWSGRWSGSLRVMLEETGVFLLSDLLPLRATDRVLILGDTAQSIADLLDSRVALEQPPITLGPPGDELAGLPSGSLPFEDDVFTIIISGHQQHTWDDDELLAFLQESWRVLTHNGIIVCWDVAPSRSKRVNAIWRRLLAKRGQPFRLRTFAEFGRLGREAGFAWIQTLTLRPFLWPPGPRLTVLMRKEHYDERTIGLAEGETPLPTKARPTEDRRRPAQSGP